MKTNHKLSVLHALLSCGCGLVLALHRGLTAADGLELAIVAMAAMLVLTLCGLGVHQTRSKLQLKPAVADKGAYVFVAAAGFLFLASAVLSLLNQDSGTALHLIDAAFAAVCGVLTLLRLIARDQGEQSAVLSLVPTFYLSFFLLMFYRSNGDNPSLLDFGYEVAVLLILLVAIYSSVADRFQEARPRFRVIFSSFGLMFAVQELVYLLMTPGMRMDLPGFSPAVLTMLPAYGLLLCLGIFYPPARVVFPIADAQPKESNTEEQTEE